MRQFRFLDRSLHVSALVETSYNTKHTSRNILRLGLVIPFRCKGRGGILPSISWNGVTFIELGLTANGPENIACKTEVEHLLGNDTWIDW